MMGLTFCLNDDNVCVGRNELYIDNKVFSGIFTDFSEIWRSLLNLNDTYLGIYN